MPELDELLTLAAPAELEIEKIKGSRFIGYASPAPNEESLRTHLEAVQALHPSARHLCYGWRGSHADHHRSSDAGEPRGSSGPPILRVIEGMQLFETAVVVVRYFGGTKLGVGGLIRAYGACARAVLETAQVVTRRRSTTLQLRFSPSLIGSVNVCLLSAGIRPSAPHFGEQVEMEIEVPAADADALHDALLNACSGQIEFERQ